MLLPYLNSGLIEAGCDEAGRGCLAGNVVAAAVILPTDYVNPLLNDSKKLTAKQRYALREQIEHEALAWAVGVATPQEIDNINILHASFLAMHRALDQLKLRPEAVIVDGNHFDSYMTEQALRFPFYGWEKNKGYPTKTHYQGIEKHGLCALHRKSFNTHPNFSKGRKHELDEGELVFK